MPGAIFELKIICGWCFVLDPAGGTRSTPPDPVARCPAGEGEERRGEGRGE